MQVTCNDCFCEFETELKKKVLKNQIHKYYFTCPDCQHEYVSYYTDAKMRRDIKRNMKKRKQHGQAKTIEESRRLLAEIKMNDKLLNKDKDALKKRMQEETLT
ncbi:hypothetical protein [Oceanobacillus indicireducens]|uniref:Transglycosylase n=1 Tax=Oceanobacillus indicireducens TaxID=1004261 RepID=A0A917XYZ9_9BACI|nr:hypothetical protein [Oceanobacillus indicireducens]GGN59396.1 hypothetical protein GCM10007971_22450 [Oceanobacillus indicireducens]